MNIEFKTKSEIKKVVKPWGHEIWLADGAPNFKYALKEIYFKSNYKTSIQFHEFKEETSYVKSGKGIFYYSTENIDLEKFKKNQYSQEEIRQIISDLQKREINSGDVIHIKPLLIHRVESINELTTIEASTIELDDVYRLNDEWNRGHGKIDSEINY